MSAPEYSTCIHGRKLDSPCLECEQFIRLHYPRLCPCGASDHPMKPKRRKKYRTGCNAKNLRQLGVRLSEDAHSTIEFLSYDENGRKLSKAKVLEDALQLAAKHTLKEFMP